MNNVTTHLLSIFRPFSCRFSAVRTWFSSAQQGPLDSIIIRGWKLRPGFPSHLSTFLQQLQDCSALQKLVLTIPCTSATAAAALGQLTGLRSLRLCMDLSLDSKAQLLQDLSDVNWTAPCWAAAIQPLTGLTSLQLKLPVVLKAQDDVRLESLGRLRRLELLLEKPSLAEVSLQGGAGRGAAVAAEVRNLRGKGGGGGGVWGQGLGT
jgi:hypothetical protein